MPAQAARTGAGLGGAITCVWGPGFTAEILLPYAVGVTGILGSPWLTTTLVSLVNPPPFEERCGKTANFERRERPWAQ